MRKLGLALSALLLVGYIGYVVEFIVELEPLFR